MTLRPHIFLIALLVSALMLPLATVSGQDVYLRGFLQGLYGGFIHEDNPLPSEYSASETRLQLRLESYSDGAEFFGRVDFVHDEVSTENSRWELREGYMKFTLLDKVDFKIGRQILTWGTGDLIFVNDLFAKDYRSFFAGRDDQYLKAPQTALRAEYYSSFGNFTLVWTPRFTPNRIPTGERFSFYNPMAAGFVGGEPFLMASKPATDWENGEFAGRFNRYIGNFSFSLYGYRGFFKNPVGFDPQTGMPFYPKLYVYGASLRGQFAGGIVWLEGGYFDSREDSDGDNSFIPNSNIQGMIGFERQIATDFVGNIQYQAELMTDYDSYQTTVVGPDEEDELRHLVTSRLTRTFMMETITLSSFVFWSPSDEDVYYRFNVDYKYNDAVKLTVGANIFDGNKKFTDFGAFALNDNLYLKMTYGF